MPYKIRKSEKNIIEITAESIILKIEIKKRNKLVFGGKIIGAVGMNLV